MADDAAAATSAEEKQITFNVKAANDQKYVVTVPENSTVADLKAKLSTTEYADLPADRQRLIFSGRVLKDPDTLASTKIKDGHTVHLVKGAASNARQNPANQGTGSASGAAAAVPQVPTNIAAGTGNNPLAGLTGARYAGFHGLPGADMFGPDGGMGAPQSPEAILEMMEDPNFLSQMNEAMNNPAIIDMMSQSPMIRNNPMLAEVIRNPEMRRMMFNPEMMRMQLQMQRAMNNNGPRFPAPGVTDTTPQVDSTATVGDTAGNSNQPNAAGSTQPQDPLAGLFGSGPTGGNPFANLFGAPGANPFTPPQQDQTTRTNTSGSNTAATDSMQNIDGTQNTSSVPPPNPFGNLFGTPTGVGGQQQPNPIADMARQMMQNPEAMQAAMNMFGQMGQGTGASPFQPFGSPPASNTGTGDAGRGAPSTNSPTPNPFAALFGPGGGFGGAGFGTPPPQDNRPPEEVYEVQLRQLNEMGFFEFDRNVSALRRSGGNVQGAIEYLLNGGS